MIPRATTTSPFGRTLRFAALAFVMLAGALQPGVGSATLGSITTRPPAPTTCDSVGLIVAGTMPSPCYQLIGAVLEGPRMLPTMGPLPTFELLVRMTVQEPNPLLDRPCPAVLQPYERGFRLGQLPAGRYLVRGVEYLVPFSPDSTAAAIDSSKLDAAFDVSAVAPCPPGKGCALLSFGPSDSSSVGRCDATAKPGGTACFDVVLTNGVPVGGVQTEITVTGPTSNTEMPGELFRPVSVVLAPPRTAGFQVAWIAEGSRTKIVLFSTTNSAIRAGHDTILHVCYAVAPEVSEGRYTLRYANTTIADPAGGEIPQCLTFAEIVGFICVAKTDGCDLNGDGASDVLDIIQLVRCALAGPGADACPDSVRAKADCNGDGLVNIRDVICCVRKILEGGGFGSGGGAPPDTSAATGIGFTGPAQWISPTEGRATIEVTPGLDFAGIQFGINAQSSPARIREVRLLEPAGAYQLESSIYPGGGIALAMLFPSAVGTAASGPIRLEVTLVPALGSSGNKGMALFSARSANLAAQAIATRWTTPTAQVPQSPAAAPSLSVPAPNPFAVGTEIAYTVPTQRRVTLRVYSVTGRLVRTLVDASVPAGVHRAQWDGRDSAGHETHSGIYFFKFTAGEVERTARVMKLR